MPYVSIAISRFRRDLAPGSRLSAPELAPRLLLCLKLLIPYIGNRSLLSARFGSWLTPFGPGVSAWALTLFELLMCYAGNLDFQI